ncbi:MAG: protein tyrosine phosphatase [Nitrosopumilaceae archaeon]|nr:protein tyrosine phosphatase [Nitrosopumilaceae archaeon]NIU00847.1 protein tyrosine phosphatase [Nitrosopumilaceae archaeon]NIU87300.1 protein tyrosine phosphatase [Nitrosopumilaceae archaeon]NIV65828.1 protein tyrosine phosphatase [Nitrosopumilaceae archaeon]NIX61449.1 protein tyrosine phosphatase [Nitrosopumilaceae archaeon]
MSKPGNMWRKLHGKITKRPTNFSWVLGDKLAGSGMPTTSEEFDWTLKQGIKSVVTLTENSLPESWIDGIDYLHVPTEDLTAPDMEKIEHAIDFIYDQIHGGKPVMVHCAAGMGRAGTILACYLIKYKKYSAQKAISKIREDRPGSIQSEKQEIAISLFEKHISKK